MPAGNHQLPGGEERYRMFTRLRATSMAGGSGMLLVLVLSGVVAAASIVTAITAPAAAPAEPLVADTTQTFEDANGNGIDDDCETGVVADPSAAASADAAVDLNGDGVISVSEAAQSGRTGGKNCNHGGYVSSVAHSLHSCTEPAASGSPEASGEPAGSADASAAASGDTTDTTCTTEASDAPESSDAPETADTPTECTPVVAPSGSPVTEPVVDESPNTHGKAVSAVAQSDAVGGKNCNHGGAVSAVAKDHSAQEARKAARDAARAARSHEKHGKKHGG
jgi:hypothetical protein